MMIYLLRSHQQHVFMFQLQQLQLAFLMLLLTKKVTIKSMRNFHRFSINKSNQSYEMLDIKNSHLCYVKDSQSNLPYMSQVVTDKGEKGIVIKLEEMGRTVIGMYNKIENSDKITIINSTNEKSVSFIPQNNNIYDINYRSIAQVKDVEPNRFLKTNFEKEGKKTRIKTISPILALSYDIYAGDFVAFSGCLGSGRTSNALSTLQSFTNSNLEQTIGIYLNTNHNQYHACTKAASKYRTLAFGRAPILTVNKKSQQNAERVLQNRSLSSVGVYMLAVKCIQTAKRLRKNGKNVMLVIDNIQQILSNQWSILQSLKLPLSPYSILNELYSASSDNQLSKQSRGSLTTIVVNSPEDQDVIQEYTTFGNNSKYLRSLCAQIQHPLQFKTNNNQISQAQTSSLRQKINLLVNEKKQKELLDKLKLTKDEPWEHYFVLDSEWWSHGLSKYRPKSFADRDLFFWFINKNVEQDYVPHWRISCIEAYQKYLDYLARPEDPKIGMESHQLQNYIEICKSQRLYDIFKKDYLN